MSSLSIFPGHDQELTPSTAYTEYSVLRVQHKPSTAFIEHSIHRVQHTLSPAYITCCIIRRSTIPHSQPVSHLSSDHVVLNSLPSHNYKLTNEWSLTSCRASLPNYHVQIDRIAVLLQSRYIVGSNCISNLTQSQPTCESPNSCDFGLHGHIIMASKCISKLPWFRAPRSRDHGILTRTSPGLECISLFTRSRFGETLALEGRKPILNTPPHLAWHLRGILDNERFWLEEHWKRVKEYEGIPGHDEPHKSRGSMNAWQMCVSNHTKCMDISKLSKCAWDQELGQIQCVFRIR